LDCELILLVVVVEGKREMPSFPIFELMITAIIITADNKNLILVFIVARSHNY
jgi:hypothetical protein